MTFLEAKVDLFENSFQSEVSVHQPLAERLRPKSLDEFVGQTKFLNTNSQLLKLIKNRGYVPNLILWGPPGTGKTTFGLLLAQLVRAEFISVNAIETGAKKLREIGQEAHQRKIQYQTATIVFVDEI
ncbi:MAG: AAA family ATPase, partial [Bdellovibrionales bacterium]|nr:AAA family ATPase [Bdellovibrionales bacterium]